MAHAKLRRVCVRLTTSLTHLALFALACALPIEAAAQTATAADAGLPVRVVGTVDDNTRVTLAQSRSPRAKDAEDRGPVSANLPLGRMLLLLKPAHAQAQQLAEYLRDVQDPASATYHRWLTPAQFGARFGVAPADVQAVTEWLRRCGFSVDAVAAGMQWIEFSGTVAQVEAAFHTSMHAY